MSARNQGDYLERQTRDALEAHGWWVIRAAGSHGIADLVALRAGRQPLLVSCKVGGMIERAERIKLWACHEQTAARPIMATREVGGWVRFYQLDSVDPRDWTLVADLKVPQRPWKRGQLVPDTIEGLEGWSSV